MLIVFAIFEGLFAGRADKVMLMEVRIKCSDYGTF